MHQIHHRHDSSPKGVKESIISEAQDRRPVIQIDRTQAGFSLRFSGLAAIVAFTLLGLVALLAALLA